MRVLVVHAHPVETSFNRALFHAAVEALTAKGNEVDALNLYDEEFQAVMSRAERLDYHDVPGNLTTLTKPYVDRLRACDKIVFVHPVWNYGYPAILKGYEVEPLRAFTVEGRGGPLEFLPFEQQHADITTLGLRMGGLAYSADVSDIPEADRKSVV